ncbi:MAG: hypothetical protein WCR97_01380 [Bacilli bacterium]
MPILNKVQRCKKCGAILQSARPGEEGYISDDLLKQFPEGFAVCEKCYENEKENIMPKEAIFDSDYKKIIEEIKIKRALVVYVVDLFSFEGSFIGEVNKMLNGCDVLAVGNKRDLLPSSIDDQILIDYVAHRLRVAKLSVVDVVLTSNKDNNSIKRLISKILELSRSRDVYFIGASISGKSTLITEILKLYKNNTAQLITTHTFAGTQLRGFRIPINTNGFIYEVPGTSIDNSLINKVEFSVQHDIVPRIEIEAKKGQIKKGDSICFGGLAMIEFIDGKPTETEVYCSDRVEVKFVRSTGEKFFGGLLQKQNGKPSSSRLNSFGDFDTYDFKVTEEGLRDIGILGLGWFKFIGNGQLYRIFVPKGVYVYSSRSKIKNVK